MEIPREKHPSEENLHKSNFLVHAQKMGEWENGKWENESSENGRVQEMEE